MISPGSIFIVRIDSDTTHCWQVRLYGKNEKYHSKAFTDGVCGGKRKARALAEKYQDECLGKLAQKVRKRQERAKAYGRAWGKGVTLRTRKRWDRDITERFWYATYWNREEGVQKKLYLSVKKWGYRAGKQMAEHFRKTGTAKVAKYGKNA